MAVLKNPKHELVAQGLFKGMSAIDAYTAAGYKPNRSHAARLVANGNIRDRVTELQSKASEKAEWSAADRLEALKRIQEATEQKDPRVAVSAIAEANKMQGSHAPLRGELSGPGGGPIPTIDAAKLSTAALAEIMAARNGDPETD